MRRALAVLITGLGLATLGAASASATIVYQVGVNEAMIYDVTAYPTYGNTMDGMKVTATFEGGTTETAVWGATGGFLAGAADGTDWGLAESGDTWAANWLFNSTNNLSLISLSLDGRGTATAFDRTFGGLEGTPGSARGRDWICTFGACSDFLSDGGTITVTYDYMLGIGVNPPVGDLFQTVLIEFGQQGDNYFGLPTNDGQTDFKFMQDTDNVSVIPEPGTLLLIGSGLMGLALRRRKG